jgi:plasmid stabilization system protein ParE
VKPIKFLPHVEFQIDDAAEWYAAQNPQVGDQFIDEINAFLERISESPRHYPIVHFKHRVRHALLDKFPYVIYCIEKADHLRVISIIHGSRSPQNWKRFLQ